MERIKARLTELQASHEYLPTSLTGTAMIYTLNPMGKAQRPPQGRTHSSRKQPCGEHHPLQCAIGKKNWLFMGDSQTGARAATFYSPIGNAHREGIDATAYLIETNPDHPTAHPKSLGR